MATSSVSTKNSIKTFANPSLTSSFVKPYYKCSLEEITKSDTIFPERSLESFHMSTQRLKEELAKIPANDDEYQADVAFKRSGFQPPEDYVLIAGDGVVSVCMNIYQDDQHDQQEIIIYHHATQTIEPLGYLPLNGYYSNFGLIGRFGCCVTEPSVLCQLSPNGDFVVVFGPRIFARPHSLAEDTPVLLVYQMEPVKLLLQKNCKKIPFVKCDASGISICPASIKDGQYRIALITESLEIRLWEAITDKGSLLQLESVSLCLFSIYSHRNPCENCLKFSPDGRSLSVLCRMENEQKCACLILNGKNLEPLCWMVFDELNTWLRWLFPIFSSCGTKIVLTTYSDSDNKHVYTKNELLFHNIPFVDESLKFLCRVVILQHVHPSSLSKLPLPNELIAFLVSGNIQCGSLESVKSTKEKIRCKCVLV